VDIAIQAKEILYHKNRLNQLIAFHTGQPIERVEADTERDFYMFSSGSQGVWSD
jgi:ATP-dependent Clp protease protease subunit